MPPQISKWALKLTEKARAAAKEGVILVSRKRKGSNSSIANADTRDIAAHTAAKVPVKRAKANQLNQRDGGSNPVLNVQVQQEVVVINLNAGSCKSSLHVQKPPSRAEESSDVDVEDVKQEEESSDVKEVEPREGETVEDKLSTSIKLQNVNTH
jgi:hypothetical protein